MGRGLRAADHGGRTSRWAGRDLGSNDQALFVVFRGTEPDNIKDWFSDLRFKQRKNPAYRGKVHRGFMQALQLVWPEVKKNIEKRLQEGVRPICFAGHSLGGALATLATQRAHRTSGFTVDGLYTYGCPRAGNPDFKRAFGGIRKRLFRFENNNDIVPKVPTSHILHYDYVHVSEPIYFKGDKKTVIKHPSAFARRSDLYFSRMRGLLEKGVDGIDDHSLQEYKTVIKRQMDRSPLTTHRVPFAGFWS